MDFKNVDLFEIYMYCVSNCVAHLMMQCVVVIGDVPGSSKLWVGGWPFT